MRHDEHELHAAEPNLRIAKAQVPIGGIRSGREKAAGEQAQLTTPRRAGASQRGPLRAPGRMAVAGNKVREIRETQMMSKAELARKAGLSTLTIDRVEAGKECRLDTKRKILQALGLRVSDKETVFETERSGGGDARDGA